MNEVQRGLVTREITRTIQKLQGARNLANAVDLKDPDADALLRKKMGEIEAQMKGIKTWIPLPR